MSSVFYTYGNSSWGDQLTAYDGTTISYDASGNPLNWRNVESLTWTGRELTYLSNDNGYNGMYFRYNADGVRTYKSHYDHNTLDMYHVNYVLDGTKIVSECYTHEITNATYTIKYYYDANNSVIGFNYNGTDYYYRKNLQGDIIAILNTNGTKVVEYTYNAWGEVLGVTGSLANTIGRINPFRYRGYYYDTETGFYYLQSRYYDPVVSRFLNADDAKDSVLCMFVLIGCNQYAYCTNIPINHTDESGKGIFPVSSLGYLYKDYEKSVSEWAKKYAPLSDKVEFGAMIYRIRVVFWTWYFMGETYKGFRTPNWYTVINGLGFGYLSSMGLKYIGNIFWPIASLYLVGFAHTHPIGLDNYPSGPDIWLKRLGWIAGIIILPIAVYKNGSINVRYF